MKTLRVQLKELLSGSNFFYPTGIDSAYNLPFLVNYAKEKTAPGQFVLRGDLKRDIL